jgi:mRNA-degrading endonuclease RelE of RelBE toxin-antitoxin system
MDIRVHPRVKKYLDESGEKDRLKQGLAGLGEDPFTPRSGLDIKKLKGKMHDVYRLRIGEHRFEYFVEDKVVWVQNAFRRERGYIQGR